MNLKYLIARDNIYMNTYDLTEVYGVGNVKLLQNNHYLPMGFMTNSALASWQVDENEDQFNPFDKQNEFFKLATGIKDDVYTPLDVVSQGHTDYNQFPVNKTGYGRYSFSCTDTTVTPHVKWNYEAPKDGLYLMYADISGGDDVTVMINDVARARPTVWAEATLPASVNAKRATRFPFIQISSRDSRVLQWYLLMFRIRMSLKKVTISFQRA